MLISEGLLVKGKSFSNHRNTGNPVSAARIYNAQYVDELLILDINATNDNRGVDYELVSAIAKECFMPVTVGGGINKIESIRKVLASGADKVLINTAAYNNPAFISKAVRIFGSQCIVIGIDVRLEQGKYSVYSKSGTNKEQVELISHLRSMSKLGVGEIVLTSIDHEGQMQGYATDLINEVKAIIQIPLVANGGASGLLNLVETFNETDVSALAMSSIYHFSDNNPIRARAYLKNHGIPIKKV